ncbi:putative reverse transcriptase protein (chloroplast) [Bryopsis sp. KO-2023]|nr:putative reverse transcriptase protein [Bryopsis sp. KO-2023]
MCPLIDRTKRKFHWSHFFYRLYKIQKRLARRQNTSRNVRNLQRLILTSFSFKIFIISQLLKNSFVSTNKFVKNSLILQSGQPAYFNQIWEYNSLKLHVLFLKKQTYCEKLIVQIQQILWVLACLPIHERLSKRLNWEGRIYQNSWHFLSYLKYILQANHIQWVHFCKYRFLFSTQIKFWLLKNFWIEKKFLINFYFQNQSNFYQKEQLLLIPIYSISFKRLLKSFFLIFYFKLLKKKIIHQTIFIHNTNLLIVCSTNFSDNYILNNVKNITRNQKNFQFQSINTYLLEQGFNLYGWKIQKYKNKLIQQASFKNIQSHQLEIKRFLKNTGNFTIDQVIFYLNQKIKIWQKIYLKMPAKKPLEKKLNNYLFWRIWYFLRKRHKTKGAKWISNKYYIKKNNKKWIFYTNNIRLIAYSSICLESKIKNSNFKNLF